MELRRYWDLLRRHGWIPVALVAATAIFSAVLALGIQRSYSATMRFVVMSAPQARSLGYFNYDFYYNYIGSEYLGDDLTELVKSRVFMDAVVKELGDAAVDVEQIMKSTKATRNHRVLAIVITSGSEDEATRIADAVAAVMQPAVSRYFPQFGSEQPFVQMIDPPETKPTLNASRLALEIGLRVALALVVGLAIVLALDYLNASIRNAEEIERTLGLPIMGEIPAET